MALCVPANLSTDTGEVFLRPTDRCFLCGEPLGSDTWIYWQGADETGHQVWLHPPCGKRLSDALKRDWIEFASQHPEKLWAH